METLRIFVLAGLLAYGATATAASYQGQVVGAVADLSEVEVLLVSSGTLERTHPDATGRFAFHDVVPGRYAIKVRADGYKTSPARIVDIPFSGKQEPFQLEQVATDPFTFHWEEDQSTAGSEYSAYVLEPPRIEFLGELIEVADDSSSVRLRHDYNVLLVDSEAASWSQEHAYRLLETMGTIPQDFDREHNPRPPSQWLLTDEFIENDIVITHHEDGSQTVLVSAAAFVNASPRIATVDGKRGTWFSRKLHHAIVRFVTDHGRDVDAYEKILQDRFGVTTEVHDYRTLTSSTTDESEASFQSFHAEEIVQLINMLEEMPSGMHKVPELRYVVRRLDGTTHPLYSDAAAVAWSGSGYIEFMDTAFLGTIRDIHRLILHEKAHFLWAHLFDDHLKDDWIELGGWRRDASSSSRWYTTKTTEFVSAYAHSENPDEDMAESIAHFIINPDKLQSRSMGKYEFIRDRIMQGNIYISQIREDLTFQVYNLFPDYVYPGKIRRVDITVEGAPNADKQVIIEIELHGRDDQEAAGRAVARIASSADTDFDLWFYPVDESGEYTTQSLVLRGVFWLSKYAKAGYWLPRQIIIHEAVGNQRFERLNDFGWKLYVDNPLEDYTPPRYVAGTAALGLDEVPAIQGHKIHVIHATWSVDEDNGVSLCHATLNDELLDTYRLENSGNYQQSDGRCHVEFVMPDYMPSSTYSLAEIYMQDLARNNNFEPFTGDFSNGVQREEPPRIKLITDNPDTQPPEVAIGRNQIQIDAKPTVPEAPNGETVVTIRFRARDDISGYTVAGLALRDPQGLEHHDWSVSEDARELFPSGDPTSWKWQTHVRILPVGSAPGTWGLSHIEIYDRAGNFRLYDFTEIIHFQVD